MSPSDLSTRRTVVSDAPIPKNRRIASRILRLPAEGSADFVARIAARRPPRPDPCGRTCVGDSNPFAPALRYTRAHSSVVVYGTPNRLEISCAATFSSSIARATAKRTSNGHWPRAFRPAGNPVS